MDRYISCGSEIEPIVHKYQEICDKCSCKRNNPILLGSYHSCDIWESDEWEDIAEYLESSEGEDIGDYGLVIVDGGFEVAEHEGNLEWIISRSPEEQKELWRVL